MLRTIICAAAILVIATATSAAPKNQGGSPSNEFRFIGYTSRVLHDRRAADASARLLNVGKRVGQCTRSLLIDILKSL